MNWPGEALLIKLWETLAEQGVGGWLEPWQIRRKALAQTEAKGIELVALADAQREADDIRSGRLKLADSRYALALPFPGGKLKPIRGRPAIEMLTSAIFSDVLRREVNVAKAIIYAESELKDDTQHPPETDIELDWLYRWRDYAGAVSSEELQSLWGRLLAGEVKAPGAYSYRTLDFIKNLTVDEAQKIGRLSRFVISDFIPKSQEALLAEEGISFSDLLGLQDLGFISGVTSSGLSMILRSDQNDHFFKALCSNGRALIVRHHDSEKKVTFAALLVTAVGRQVLRLGKFNPHERYLLAVAKEFKRLGATVSIANYRDVSESRIQVVDERSL